MQGLWLSLLHKLTLCYIIWVQAATWFRLMQISNLPWRKFHFLQRGASHSRQDPIATYRLKCFKGQVQVDRCSHWYILDLLFSKSKWVSWITIYRSMLYVTVIKICLNLLWERNCPFLPSDREKIRWKTRFRSIRERERTPKPFDVVSDRH